MATQVDAMTQFEEELNAAQQRNSTVPFFFSLKDSDTARIRLLLNFPANVRLNYHSRYDETTRSYIANNVCAQEFGQACFYCEQAKTTDDWKLKAQRYAYLPVYVHAVKHQQADKSWSVVTFKEDGVDKPVCGVRMLEMKLRSSTILNDLLAAFGASSDEPSERDITQCDFVVARKGEGLAAKYTVTIKPGAPLALPSGLVDYTTERVKSDIEMHRPMKTIGGASDMDEDASTNVGDHPW